MLIILQKKWDPTIEHSVFQNINGEEIEEISCSQGTMEFVRGKLL